MKINEINPSLLYTIIGICIVLVLAIIVVIIIISRSKKNKIKIDSKFIDDIFHLLGGEKNLLSTDVENGRLRLKIKNLDLVNLNGLKELSTAGVFVTGDCIKLLFKTDSQIIKKELDMRIK